MNWDSNELKELAELLRQYDLTELEVVDGEKRILIKKETNSTYAEPLGYRPTQQTGNANRSFPDLRQIIETKSTQDQATLIQERIENTTQKRPSQNRTETSEDCITAPVAGIFYRQSKPDNPPYVEVGQQVKKGDILCLVEVMKMINEVPSPYDGTVKQFLVKNEQYVEYDTPLVIIDKE